MSEKLVEALKRSLSWLSSYPGGGAIGAYEQARQALADYEAQGSGINVTGPDEDGSVYVYFQQSSTVGETVRHFGMTNIDYDKEGKLFGIEILGVANEIPTSPEGEK